MDSRGRHIGGSGSVCPRSRRCLPDRNRRLRRVHGHRRAAAAQRGAARGRAGAAAPAPAGAVRPAARGPAPAELAGLLPAPAGAQGAALPGAAAPAACTCGRAGCAHAAAAERAVAARLAAEPLLQLAHAGLPREALLAGVLGSWAAELAHDPSGAGRAAETAGRPQARAGEGGAAVGEWIAEAAADGAMHQPGPGFGAVQVRLAQPGKPPALPELTALLPGVPAAAGLDLIRERVAARMWQAVQKRKDSPAAK